MALAGHHLDHSPGNKDFETRPGNGDNEKGLADQISNISGAHIRTFEAPEWIRNLTPEQRAAAETKLVRKIDFRLLPMVIMMYIMNYLDRNNIAAAKLAGLMTELKLTSVQYNTSVSILFVGYLLMQVPSNLFLNKIGKPSLYLPTAMITWGLISACTGAVHSFGGLIAVRFMLGFIEAAYFPGCLYFLSCWYTRKELGLRTALLYSGALISGAFSGLIAAGITGNMNGTRGLLAWRWLFIIEGTATIAIAFAAYFILPNFPRTTSWLSQEERDLAVWRLEEDIGEDDWIDAQHQTFWDGVRLAFTDPKMYILMVMLFGMISAGSVTNFFPSVVATLGFSTINSLLLTAPPYIFATIAVMANGWHADRTGERFWHVVIPELVAMAAFIIAAATTATGPRYFAMMLMVAGVYSGYVVVLAWVSNTMPRPPAKRAVALAWLNAVSNSSSIYASYMYPDTDAPRYVVAMSVDCATAFVAILMAILLRFILVRLNKKLDRGEYVEGAINDKELQGNGGIDLQGARKRFRFKL